MRRLTGIFAFLCLLVWPALAAGEWHHAGAHWSHPLGFSFDLPEGLQAKEDPKDASLEITSKSGDLFVGYYPMAEQGAADAMVGALAQKLGESQGKLGAPQEIAASPGLTLKGQEGTALIEGQSAEVSIGYFTNQKVYLVFFTTYASERKAQLDELVGKMMGTVQWAPKS